MTAIKLRRQLSDLFQFCELKCNAACCGWDAFDLSEHWLHRWCEFREADAIMAARSEITCIRNDLAGRNLDDPVVLDRFFNPSVQSLSDHLDAIDVALAEYSEPRSIWRRKGDAAD